MEKNRIRSVKTGKSMRMSYQRQEEVLEMPNLIEVQRDSYKWFLDEGLREVFDDISPIADYSGKLSLEFIDFTFDEKDAKYTIEQCKERDATYAAPLKVRVRLINKETEEINEHEIFMGDLPIMTVTGTFVINGAERVIVSQLVRSPGIYYAIAHDKLGKRLFSSTVIPNRGAWLEYETDSNDVFYVRVDRTRKVPITVLIRALGVGSNAEIIDLFGEEPKILASFTKDTSTNYQEGLLELYKKIRPGEPLAVESAESLINAMFFDPRRYDLAKVGRYKFNKKLHLNRRIVGHRLAEDVVDASTGEILAEEGTVVTKEMANTIQNSAVPYVWILGEEDRRIKVLSNLMVDIRHYLPEIEDPKSIGVTEAVYYPVLENILEENDTLEDRIAAIHRDIHDLIPKHITKEDIFASINYNMHLEYGLGNADDIDHLGNRRIRAVGELLQNQYRIGLSRLERVVRERMTTQDLETITPQSLINIVIITNTILKMHIIINRSNNIFFCNMFRNQIMDVSADCILDFFQFCIFFQNLCQHWIINQLCNTDFFRIHIYIMAQINHHIGQNFCVTLFCLNPDIRNCRILDCICQFTVNFLTCFCQHFTCTRIHNILCQYMSVDAVFQH